MNGLTETWLTETDLATLFTLNGYRELIHKPRRSSGIGGSVAFYVKDHLNVKIIEIQTNLEALTIETSGNLGKSAFCCVYNPPSDSFVHFLSNFEKYR